MRYKKILKVVSLIFVVLFLMLSLPLAVFAGDASSVKKIEESDVYEDLKKMGFDLSKLTKDEKAEHVSLIDFLEYGYDYNGNASEYGLYLYIYNPSGKQIDTSSLYGYKNSVQLQVSLPNGEEKGWAKYRMTLLSASDENGLENVFLKFKVDVPQSFMMKPSKAARHYELADIELIFVGENKAKSYGAGGKWSYTGYQAYHGPDRSSAVSTLRYSANDFLTLELEINPVTWKTKTSDKGEGYQYELFSVYFSVPNSVIREYGDMNDATKGLRAVNGVYSEYKVNGLLTNNKTLYDTVKPYLGKSAESASFGFFTPKMRLMGSSTQSLYSYNASNFLAQMPGVTINPVKYLNSVYNTNYDNFESSSWFSEEFEKLRNELGGFYKLSENKDFYYSVTTEDGDLKNQMASYIDKLSNTNWFTQWLSHGYTYADDPDIATIPMEPIVYVSAKDVSDGYNDEYNAKHLFVSDEDYDNLESYVQSLDTAFESVFLMRYALRDYYISDVYVAQKGSGNDIGFDNGNYYFEKNIFLDFDILSLTWEDEHGGIKVIPVTASPIDHVGTVTKPPQTGIGATLNEWGDTWDKIFDFLSSLSWISILLGVVLLFLLIRLFPNFFRFITAPIRWLFGGIGKLLGFAKEEMRERGRERRAEKRDMRYEERGELRDNRKAMRDDMREMDREYRSEERDNRKAARDYEYDNLKTARDYEYDNRKFERNETGEIRREKRAEKFDIRREERGEAHEIRREIRAEEREKRRMDYYRNR